MSPRRGAANFACGCEPLKHLPAASLFPALLSIQSEEGIAAPRGGTMPAKVFQASPEYGYILRN
jgi:hypothetical protein